jgi:3-hydroxymyristoyl/3-hydroxydecanoyl-(acyl carrier protein) dehydratase
MHADFLRLEERLMQSLEECLSDRPDEGVEQSAGQLRRNEAPTGAEDETPFALTTGTRRVGWDDWFLDSHVMPAGVVLEPLGRVATPLPFECQVQHFGPLPEPGNTVVTELRIQGSPGVARTEAGLGFHLECVVGGDGRRLATVHGRSLVSGELEALARGSAAAAPVKEDGAWTWTSKRHFGEADLVALFAGDLLACFGKGFERAASHTRTPPLPGAALIRLTSVSALEPAGGTWSRGLLCAQVTSPPETALPPGEEALVFGRIYQGALQTLAFFVMAAGGTIERDGWRFEPLEGVVTHMCFTGTPPPDSLLEYELTVECFEGGPRALVVGDVKVRAGGSLVFQAEGLGVRLFPDWPLSSDRQLQAQGAAEAASGRPAVEIEGFRIGYSSLLAGAVGRPGDAFREPGTFFETGERQMPRLPGLPYHFITRITAVDGERLTMRPGAEGTFEYDVPPDAWYFDENGNRTMPFCVLLEAALQPCGWLSVYVGCPLTTTEDVFFRNLDGVGMTMTGEVFPESGTLRTHAKVVSVTRVSSIMFLSYRIELFLADEQVCHLNATFGYFPKEALALQAGLKTTDEQKSELSAESPLRFDLAERSARHFAGPLRMPGPILLMIDRVTGYWPNGGPAGKGRLRGEKDVKPSEWFFKAHFFSDPVQPGTLGLEMMLQLLQFFVIEQELGKDIEQPYFEPLALDCPVSWKYRGQVRPENHRVVTDVDIVSVESRPEGVTVIANGSLWVDGVRCYEANGMGMRVRGGRPAAARPSNVVDSVVDPGGADRWVADHRPSHTVPVMPMMSMVDRLAGASLAFVRAAYPSPAAASEAPDWVVLGGEDLRVHGWLVCDDPKRLRTDVKLVKGRASVRVEELEASATLYELIDGDSAPRRVATGRVRLGRRWPAPPLPWAPLAGAVPSATPYESGAIGHGPALQIIRRIAYSERGATADLDAGGARAPIGTLHQVLLDGALQAIPHDELERWSDKIAPGHVGIPVRSAARFFGPPPQQGNVRLEIRFLGFDGAAALPLFGIQMIDPQGRVWATLRHVELLVPSGHESFLRHYRVPFLVERQFVEGACLSRFHPDRTELADADVKRMDWLPGSVAYVYGLEKGAPIDNRSIAIKDHVAQRTRVHPSRVEVNAARTEGRSPALPLTRFRVTVEQRGSDVIVRDAGPPEIEAEERDER